jgi:hypothetical protein
MTIKIKEICGYNLECFQPNQIDIFEVDYVNPFTASSYINNIFVHTTLNWRNVLFILSQYSFPDFLEDAESLITHGSIVHV